MQDINKAFVPFSKEQERKSRIYNLALTAWNEAEKTRGKIAGDLPWQKIEAAIHTALNNKEYHPDGSQAISPSIETVCGHEDCNRNSDSNAGHAT